MPACLVPRHHHTRLVQRALGAIAGQFQLGLEASYSFDSIGFDEIKGLKISGNIINLTDKKGVADIGVPGSPASGGYTYYPLPPRMFFVTVSAGL